MVTIAILSILTAVAGLSIRRAPSTQAVDSTSAQVAQARTRAIAEGRPITITISTAGHQRSVTAYPSGDVISDSGVLVDRLTGRVPHASR